MEIPTDVHDKFVATNLKYQGNRVINLNENIQRVEIINMKTNFNSFKNSSFTFDLIFYKQIAEAFTLSPDQNKKIQASDSSIFSKRKMIILMNLIVKE